MIDISQGITCLKQLQRWNKFAPPEHHQSNTPTMQFFPDHFLCCGANGLIGELQTYARIPSDIILCSKVSSYVTMQFPVNNYCIHFSAKEL